MNWPRLYPVVKIFKRKFHFRKVEELNLCNCIFLVWIEYHVAVSIVIKGTVSRDFRHYLSFSGVNDTAETASAVSMTQLKPFQRYQWHRWNHHDREMKNLIGISTTNIFFCRISAVSLTQRKQLWGSGLKFQRCQWHRFWWLLKRLSRRIRSHMRNGFSLLIRDLYGVDWWKKPRVENLVTLSL
jgi:hypothetical protein